MWKRIKILLFGRKLVPTHKENIYICEYGTGVYEKHHVEGRDWFWKVRDQPNGNEEEITNEV